MRNRQLKQILLRLTLSLLVVALGSAQRATLPDFANRNYALGDFDKQLWFLLAGGELNLEQSDGFRSCQLEVPLPTTPAHAWIHDMSLNCRVNNEEQIWPLGEAELRRGYRNNRVVFSGEAANFLLEKLALLSDRADVEQPVSSRFFDWGPERRFELISLRKNSERGSLTPALECLREVGGLEHRSCTLFLSNINK